MAARLQLRITALFSVALLVGASDPLPAAVAAQDPGNLPGQTSPAWQLTAVSPTANSGSGSKIAFTDTAVRQWLTSSINNDVPRLSARGWRLVAHSASEANEWCVRRIRFLKGSPMQEVKPGTAAPKCKIYSPGHDLLKYEYAPENAFRDDSSDGCSLMESVTGKFYFGIMCEEPTDITSIELTQVSAKESRDQGRVEQWHSGEWREIGEMVSLPVSGSKVVFKMATCQANVCTADHVLKKVRDWPQVCQKETCVENECCDQKESDIKFVPTFKGFDHSKLTTAGKNSVKEVLKVAVKDILEKQQIVITKADVLVRELTVDATTDPKKMSAEVRVRLPQDPHATFTQAHVVESLKASKQAIADAAVEKLKVSPYDSTGTKCTTAACVTDPSKVSGSIDKVEEVPFEEPNVKFEIQLGATTATEAELRKCEAKIKKVVVDMLEQKKKITVNVADMTLKPDAGSPKKMEVSIVPGISSDTLRKAIEDIRASAAAGHTTAAIRGGLEAKVKEAMDGEITAAKVGTISIPDQTIINAWIELPRFASSAPWETSNGAVGGCLALGFASIAAALGVWVRSRRYLDRRGFGAGEPMRPQQEGAIE